MDDDKKQNIIDLLKDGKSYRYIQEKLNVSPNSISNMKTYHCCCPNHELIDGYRCKFCDHPLFYRYKW